MAYKTILTPQELGDLVPHWPALEAEKLTDPSRAGVRYGKERHPHRGVHVEGKVLSVPPIIVTRSTVDPNAYLLMDGKHRTVTAIRRDTGLVTIVLERAQDIHYALPRAIIAQLKASCSVSFEDFFFERDMYERITREKGVNSMRDLIARRIDGLAA